MKTNPCKECGSAWHTRMYHKSKPLVASKSIRKIGPVTKKWLKTKELWFERNKQPYYACDYCGKIMTRTQLTLDHVKSRSKHPELRFRLDNLVPACWSCNTEKGSTDAGVFRHLKDKS